MQGAIKGIQEQLVIINQRMADFVEHSKMDELTNKIEEERTDAADTRTRLADKVIKMKDDISDFKKDSEDNKNKISTMVEQNNLIKDEVTMIKQDVKQNIKQFDDKINNISEATDEGLRDKVNEMKKDMDDIKARLDTHGSQPSAQPGRGSHRDCMGQH